METLYLKPVLCGDSMADISLSFKIKLGEKELELTEEEAKLLYHKLHALYGTPVSTMPLFPANPVFRTMGPCKLNEIGISGSSE